MNTDIEYLRQLETDLMDAAARETARRTDPRSTGAATPARGRTGRVWVKVAGVAAAFLVVAGAIGFIAEGTDGSPPPCYRTTQTGSKR